MDLQEVDVTMLCGVPVTTPVRTALDCGRLLARMQAAAAVDAFLHSGLVKVPQLQSELHRFDSRRGVRQLRWAVEYAEPLAESPMETWTRVRLTDAGLPRPRVQIPIPRRFDEVPYRLDMGYERELVAIEYDGIENHDTPTDRAHDLVRRRWIESERGWHILVVDRGDVLRGWRALVSATADALISRGWVPPRGATIFS